jgi:hypothetical protein
MTATLVHVRKRSTLRRAVRIDCQVVRERDFKLVARRTVDLSTDGMLVASEVDVLPGEELIVSFKTSAFNIYIAADATVARVIQGRRPGDRGRCLGLKFRELDAVSRLVLRGSLRKVPPPLPQRERLVDYAATIRRISEEIPSLITPRQSAWMDSFYFN